MGSRMQLYGKHDKLLGVFTTHLDPDEAAAVIEEEGVAAFADWSGEFVPADPDAWQEDAALIVCRDGTRWSRLIDQVGDITET